MLKKPRDIKVIEVDHRGTDERGCPWFSETYYSPLGEHYCSACSTPEYDAMHPCKTQPPLEESERPELKGVIHFEEWKKEKPSKTDDSVQQGLFP